jgi:hypothetical protein
MWGAEPAICSAPLADRYPQAGQLAGVDAAARIIEVANRLATDTGAGCTR